jgi:dsRNA-specific ribonuclease
MRINELLIVKELNAKLFSNMISDQLLRAALTPPSAGVDVNYERLEILG